MVINSVKEEIVPLMAVQISQQSLKEPVTEKDRKYKKLQKSKLKVYP